MYKQIIIPGQRCFGAIDYCGTDVAEVENAYATLWRQCYDAELANYVKNSKLPGLNSNHTSLDIQENAIDQYGEKIKFTTGESKIIEFSVESKQTLYDKRTEMLNNIADTWDKKMVHEAMENFLQRLKDATGDSRIMMDSVAEHNQKVLGLRVRNSQIGVAGIIVAATALIVGISRVCEIDQI